MKENEFRHKAVIEVAAAMFGGLMSNPQISPRRIDKGCIEDICFKAKDIAGELVAQNFPSYD